MTTSSRRDFLQRSALGATALAVGPFGRMPQQVDQQARSSDPQAKSLKILILGGTAFVGPHLVEAAQARGHEVTLFNRGRTNTHLFPELEKLRGDRDPQRGEGLKALEGRRWDAVIDTSGYVPRIVRASAELLAEAVDHYVFISTLSVYADRTQKVSEASPVGTLEDESVERITGQTYGPLKALCEQAAEIAMPGRVGNIRPGLIVGPLDRSDRFTYWPVRVQRGGEVLAPGQPETPIQVIDVRDLAEWTLTTIERKTTGVFNAIGPKTPVTMQEFLHGCKIVLGSDARFTWVSDAFLVEQQIRAYTEMPLWIPMEAEALRYATNDKAVAAGLEYRPLGETIRDTAEWANERPDDYRWRGGLAAEKEARLLREWQEREG